MGSSESPVEKKNYDEKSYGTCVFIKRMSGNLFYAHKKIIQAVASKSFEQDIFKLQRAT
jgi:hypothetical protein